MSAAEKKGALSARGQAFLHVRKGNIRGNGEGRNRTADAEIFSLSLYRLSYLACL
jgi:hypothetical protein